jgi:DnaK suppressor protein
MTAGTAPVHGRRGTRARPGAERPRPGAAAPGLAILASPRQDNERIARMTATSAAIALALAARELADAAARPPGPGSAGDRNIAGQARPEVIARPGVKAGDAGVPGRIPGEVPVRALPWARNVLAVIARPGRESAGLGAAARDRKAGNTIMLSVDLATRVSERLPARPVEDLPQWRDWLEELWRLQVAEIIELSLAYHQAAAARPPGRPDPADPRACQLRRILARTASAHHALAEIEAAMGRIDTGSYGICGHCGLPVEAGWLDARPLARYCPHCHPQQAVPDAVGQDHAPGQTS